MASKYLWLLDPGHGGLVFGQYLTPGKRSPKLEDGRQLFEGEFNRDIVARLKCMCQEEGIECFDLVDTHFDIPLAQRVELANSIFRKQLLAQPSRWCIYVSIHANAYVAPGRPLEFNEAHGWEAYTSKGETPSDRIATHFTAAMKKTFPDAHFREDHSDNDLDKEADFYVLRNTAMPAVLTENFFMTNRNELDILLSEEGRDKIARAHLEAMKAVEEVPLV